MKKPFLHPKEKVLLYMLLIALLLANTAAINIGVASADETTKLYVDPPSIIDPTLLPPAFFSINVTVANVTDLYGFEFKLRYNTTILTGLGVIIVPFPNQTDYTSNTSINDEKGIIFVNVTYHPPAEPLTTTDPVTLARIFFLVTAVGSTDLDLYDTILVDSKGEEIPHSAEDGYFSNCLLPPVALFTYSPLLPLVGENVTFNASASYDPDGTIVSYFWDFGDGTNATGIVVNHTYMVPGVYTVNLTVTDNDALASTFGKTVTVIKTPVAFFTYSPAAPLVNETVTFDASLSTPDGGYIVNYAWNFDDGNITTTIHPIINHTYTAAGVYTVNLTVTDNASLTDTTWHIVKVGRWPIAKFTYSPEFPLINQMVTFNATDSHDIHPDQVGTIVSYAWDFGDGTTDSGVIVYHNYTAFGAYNVTLTVTDDEGLTNITTRSIMISKLSSSISISAAPTTIEVGEDTTISGSITPARVGVTVTIHYRLTGGTWNTTTVTTNLAGGYSYAWTPGKAGEYEVYASRPEDATTLGAVSSVITITVEEAPPSPSPPYTLYLVAIIAIVVLAATAIYYLKKKR